MEFLWVGKAMISYHPVNMLFNTVTLRHFNTGIYGDWLAFAESLKWHLEELQFCFPSVRTSEDRDSICTNVQSTVRLLVGVQSAEL